MRAGWGWPSRCCAPHSCPAPGNAEGRPVGETGGKRGAEGVRVTHAAPAPKGTAGVRVSASHTCVASLAVSLLSLNMNTWSGGSENSAVGLSKDPPSLLSSSAHGPCWTAT